jgi:hypothetical protein
MATDRQIAAKRQNTKNSTGPRTEHGKRRSRRIAVRHRLTAETVIDVLEDPVDYEALEPNADPAAAIVVEEADPRPFER